MKTCKNRSKLLPALLCAAILLCLPGAGVSTAAAAGPDLTQYAIANATVQASSFSDVTAPCSGTLLSFDWEAGDRVEEGAALFEIMTTDLCAPEDGTVRYLFAEAGDSADAVSASYGAVLALEPAAAKRMHCSYTGAADYTENKHLHVGDTLYFRSGQEKGTGTVIAVDGQNYEVEIRSGSFDRDKTLDLYKDSAYGAHDKVGSGKVYERDDLLLTASGRVAELSVQAGDEVKKGDVLLRVLPQDAPAGATPVIFAPADGVVGSVAVSPGQQVWKGQLLCRVLNAGTPEIVAEVDEMDLGDLQIGDKLPVTLDTDEAHILTGTVTEISGLGVARQNAAYYAVHLSVESGGLRLGQSASVYLPRDGE